MKINRILLGALSACFAFSLLAAQSVRADDQPVTLARTAKAEEKTRYKIVLKAEVQGLPATLTTVRKDVVKEVKDNGNIVTVVTPESAEAEFAGNPLEVQTPPPYTLTRNKQGKLLDYKTDKEDESLLTTSMWKLVNALTEPILADKAIKPNDTWETEFDNPVAEGKKFTVKSTYIGTEKVEGVELWKLKQTAEPVDKDGNKMGYEQTSWLDPMNGHIVKVEAVMKEVPTNTQFGKMTFNMKVTPIKDDKKPEEKKAPQ